jgi:peptidylprolyl isomerase
VENIRRLVAAGAFDGGAVVRSQDNYVAQWSVAPMEEGAWPPEGVAAILQAEFELPAAGLPFTPVPDGDVYAPEAGFTLGFPVARDPRSGTTWGVHCYGMVGVARGNDPDSGSGASLYAVTGHSPRHLDRNITVVGRVIVGMEHLTTLPRGTGNLGFYEAPQEPMPIAAARLGTQLDGAALPDLQLLRTESSSFEAVIQARRNRREAFFVNPADRVEVCNVPLPIRVAGS